MNDSLLDKANVAIEAFLDTNPRACDPDEYGRIYQKANISLRLRHDQIVNARIETDQKLRVIGLAITDTKLREAYCRASMPKLLPELKSKPSDN